MKVNRTDTTVPFGYSHLLKDLYRSGKLPTVKRGFYGDRLTLKNVSLEHLKPISKGGRTTLSNLVLASREKNQLRGNDYLFKYVTPNEMWNYLKQFFNVRVEGFNGDKYIQDILNTIGGLKNGKNNY